MYSKRRIVRYRMMRKAVFMRRLNDAVTSAKSFASEILCAIGILIGVFYLIPVAIKIIVSTIK